MSNMFSIFDPVVWNLGIGWISIIAPLWLLPFSRWASTRRSSQMLKSLARFLVKEINNLFSIWALKRQILIYTSIFLRIVVFNCAGLMPYVFTPSSHFSICVSIGLPLWLGHLLYSLLNSPLTPIRHLVPMGSPYILAPFIVIIELIRNIIRPLTLAIRLTANMVAGHLLLSLLASQFTFNSKFRQNLGLAVALRFLTILELGVALVQGYVFSILSCIYVNEVERPWLN